MKLFKRKKPEQYHPEGFTPELDRAVFKAQIIVLERRLKEAKEANNRLLAENKRLIGKNVSKLFASK